MTTAPATTANPVLDALVVTDYQSEEEQRIAAMIKPGMGTSPTCDDCDTTARYMIEPPVPSSPAYNRTRLYDGWAYACDRHLEAARYQMAIRVLERMPLKSDGGAWADLQTETEAIDGDQVV